MWKARIVMSILGYGVHIMPLKEIVNHIAVVQRIEEMKILLYTF